jgi:UDP-N-acetylglucosamine 3-dehydrogenase
MTYRVGIIGTGRPWRSEGATGMGMANFHAMGYQASPDVSIHAVCDIVRENAEAFAERYGAQRVYLDYQEMLGQESLDIVSVCTWPAFHAPMVEAAARAGVKAIHCEKPMADTYGGAKRMVEVCDELGVQLTVSHQRRFVETYVKAKELLDAGRIGDLLRIEMQAPNMYDWGTHYIDSMFYYNNETPAQWVIGQIDGRESALVFQMPNEAQAVSYIRFANDVYGLAVTGHGAGMGTRLIGTDGQIQAPYTQEQPLRVWGIGDRDWQVIDVDGFVDGPTFPGDVQKAILDVIDCLKTGRTSTLDAHNALRTTEVIFATYESSRRRGRVDLPLDIDDNPFVAMVEAGEIEFNLRQRG